MPTTFVAPEKGTEGPHATPNSAIIPAHLAVQALVSIDAVNACVQAIGTDHSTMALWALRYMHDPQAVEGLIYAYKEYKNEALRTEILTTLSRIYQKEAPYDGSWWWSTRPDTHGPYYKAVAWESSPEIKDFLMTERNNTNAAGKQFFADLNGKLRMGITEFGGEEEEAVASQEEAQVDLGKISKEKGQIGKSSIEDIMLALDDVQGDPGVGQDPLYQTGLCCLS